MWGNPTDTDWHGTRRQPERDIYYLLLKTRQCVIGASCKYKLAAAVLNLIIGYTGTSKAIQSQIPFSSHYGSIEAILA